MSDILEKARRAWDTVRSSWVPNYFFEARHVSAALNRLEELAKSGAGDALDLWMDTAAEAANERDALKVQNDAYRIEVERLRARVEELEMTLEQEADRADHIEANRNELRKVLFTLHDVKMGGEHVSKAKSLLEARARGTKEGA